MIRRALIPIVAFIASIAATLPAVADTIIAPDNFYIGNLFPFGGVGDIDYQQVYSSSFFSGRIKITGLSFFIAPEPTPNAGFVLGDYVVSLSTTSVAVGALDPFDMTGNLGADNKVVFKGTLDGGSSIDVKPFFYDASMGNLLMTVEVTDRLVTGTTDGAFWRADYNMGTSRAWYAPMFDPSAPFSSDNVGLVTAFTFRQVPEPTTLALLSLGLAGLGFKRRKQ